MWRSALIAKNHCAWCGTEENFRLTQHTTNTNALVGAFSDIAGKEAVLVDGEA